MSEMWYILFPEPPRFLQSKFLFKHAGTATAWLAFLNVQASIAIVPGLLWYIAGLLLLAVSQVNSQQPAPASLLQAESQ